MLVEMIYYYKKTFKESSFVFSKHRQDLPSHPARPHLWETQSLEALWKLAPN